MMYLKVENLNFSCKNKNIHNNEKTYFQFINKSLLVFGDDTNES